MILLELKDDPIPDPGVGFVIPHHFGAVDLDKVDRKARAVFSEDDLLTPDDVRGDHATLEEAVLADGWPRLDATRGKVLFALDNEGEEKSRYLSAHPSLRGRVMFTSSRPGAPEAAFVKLNDPVADGALDPRSRRTTATSSGRAPTPTRCRPAPVTPPSATRRSAVAPSS